MPENHFGERVAERSDTSDAGMFEPAVVDPVVDCPADLACFQNVASHLAPGGCFVIGVGRLPAST